jgi:diguanylate cyclase (GGDEF)-like protein/PAS domain S-box-containing protein
MNLLGLVWHRLGLASAAMLRAVRRRLTMRPSGLEARKLAERFDTALNNMSEGLCFFDGEKRLIVCNRRYLEMYGLSPERVGPGATLAEVVELRCEAGSSPAVTKEEYLLWCDRQAVANQPFDTVVELQDGRFFEIHHRPMPDGGWVATHEDVTERFHAERALAEAKAVAERAENEARAAHATLVAALDAVPEGLVIFDSEDRYVLWNRRYSEISAVSGHLPAVGRRFEDTLRAGLLSGNYPDARGREEEWLQERLALHALPQSTHEQQLSGNHWQRIEERRIAGGGSIGVRIDITDLKRREASFRLLFEGNPVPMYVYDRGSLRFLAVNDAAVQHYGYDRSWFLQRTLLDIRPAEDHEKLRQAIGNGDSYAQATHGWRHCKSDGTLFEAVIYARELSYEGHEAALAAVFDVTDRKRAEQQVAHLARHDPLTDLPNRTAFNERLADVFAHASTSGGRFAVLCIDLDRFKEINDLLGHSVGDAVLREASSRLKAATQDAFVARVGGDELVAITEEHATRSTAEALARRLHSSFDSDLDVEGHAVHLDLSIGIAMFPDDGRETTTLLSNADAALYRAKHDGRGVTRFFTTAMDRQLRERRVLLHDLRSCVGRNELVLEYQPQSTIRGDITGFEALVRWHHPVRGLIQPGQFIPIAEESGLIIEVGEWVLREACREAASWPQTLKVGVNLSAIQFRLGNLHSTVHSILLETGLAPDRLELEITEGVLIENVSRAASMLRSLKALGVRIALDDFGTGHSSLSYLESFTLDRIKIDRAFVSHLGRSDRSLAIVRAVIGLAHGLGIPVLAEGVETADQLAILTREQCDDIQGHFVGRPRVIDAYATIVGRRPRRRENLLTG